MGSFGYPLGPTGPFFYCHLGRLCHCLLRDVGYAPAPFFIAFGVKDKSGPLCVAPSILNLIMVALDKMLCHSGCNSIGGLEWSDTE